tara:strand:+ start:1020 stop:1313 length:294 start_codon:yes stop_codon:yes gene_type:complete
MSKSKSHRKYIYTERRPVTKARTPNHSKGVKGKIGISDHALVRYCEYELGVDFDELRKKLLTPDAIKRIRMGAATIPYGNGKLMVADNTITTFIPNK